MLRAEGTPQRHPLKAAACSEEDTFPKGHRKVLCEVTVGAGWEARWLPPSHRIGSAPTACNVASSPFGSESMKWFQTSRGKGGTGFTALIFTKAGQLATHPRSTTRFPNGAVQGHSTVLQRTKGRVPVGVIPSLRRWWPNRHLSLTSQQCRQLRESRQGGSSEESGSLRADFCERTPACTYESERLGPHGAKDFIKLEE